MWNVLKHWPHMPSTPSQQGNQPAASALSWHSATDTMVFTAAVCGLRPAINLNCHHVAGPQELLWCMLSMLSPLALAIDGTKRCTAELRMKFMAFCMASRLCSGNDRATDHATGGVQRMGRDARRAGQLSRLVAIPMGGWPTKAVSALLPRPPRSRMKGLRPQTR
jgi:hypothetical protein